MLFFKLWIIVVAENEKLTELGDAKIDFLLFKSLNVCKYAYETQLMLPSP
jgi:hypothetical protein